ncbi:Alpha-1,3/1,6-mannosyltransferase ALG2 [Capsicum chinense]|nr:Alpha-1,3/1,6-mannosyltransferase ALG2 [Capsicum chinense]
MEKKGSSKMNVAIIHPDLGIGGAERLIVDAAMELASLGHKVHIFTSHHDKNRCFEETLSGVFDITVYGSFLPRHIFYRLHAVCAYLRCMFVSLCLLFMWPSFDIILADQVSVVIPLLKLKKSAKVVFYCHFPDLLLAQHTTILRRIYRKPIDFIEEITTGMADLILVNSKENVEYLEELKKLAEREGVSQRVKFITSCSTAERNALLGQCLCVLYTPKDEHFGIVPLEAMAAYKPVIACNSGGPVETVKHGVTGFLCDPNPKEFASAMSNFIQDPHMSEKMGQDARQHVAESFSTKIFGQHLNRYLVDVARGKEE